MKTTSAHDASSGPISLDELVAASDEIVVAQWAAQSHSAFAPRDPFDGTLFRFTEALLGPPLSEEKALVPFLEYYTYSVGFPRPGEPVGRQKDPRIFSRSYKSSVAETDLFSKSAESEPAILFLVRSTDGIRRRLACEGAWEAVSKKAEVLAAIARRRRSKPSPD